MTEESKLLNTTLTCPKDLCRKIVMILHGKWEAPLFSGRGTSGRGYDNSWPHSAIWWNVYYLEKSSTSIKSHHMEILKIKLSLASSTDSSLVSEDGAPTVLRLGHRRNSSFHASQHRLHNFVVRHAKRIQELGANPSSVTDWLCYLGWVNLYFLYVHLYHTCFTGILWAFLH